MSQLRVSHLSDSRQIAGAINGALRRTDGIDLSSDQQTILLDRDISLATGEFYKVNLVQVVGPRETGWTADTGAASKAAAATYAAGATLTFTDPPSAAEMSALATRLAAIEAALQAATEGKKAVKDALILHGLIGA